MTKTMIAHKRQLQGTPRPSKSKQLQVALGRSSLENLQSLKRRSDLEKRSLCLLCPVGVKILGVLLHDKGLNSRLCCPPQKIYTKYAKKIVTATIRPNVSFGGAASISDFF